MRITNAMIRTGALSESASAVPGRLVGEASSVGLPPGPFPKFLKADPDVGNGEAFYLIEATSESALYKQMFGLYTLQLLND